MEADEESARGVSHRFAADQRDTTRDPACSVCRQTRSYRAHQPLWWRLLNGRNWR